MSDLILCKSNTGNDVTISISAWRSRIINAYMDFGTRERTAKEVQLHLGLSLKSARALTCKVLDGVSS